MINDLFQDISPNPDKGIRRAYKLNFDLLPDLSSLNIIKETREGVIDDLTNLKQEDDSYIRIRLTAPEDEIGSDITEAYDFLTKEQFDKEWETIASGLHNVEYIIHHGNNLEYQINLFLDFNKFPDKPIPKKPIWGKAIVSFKNELDIKTFKPPNWIAGVSSSN